jgi:tRNA-specific 2-thiouridylase
LYVTRLDATNNRVEVGPDAALLRDELWCDEAFLRDPVGTAAGLRARTRYRHPGLPVRAVEWHEDRLRIVLEAPDRAPAPGQSVVLDRDGVVVGGGRLREEACAS